jgi:peptidoglycan-associated lipoprotein
MSIYGLLAVALLAAGCASTKPVVQVDDSAEKARAEEEARRKEAEAKAKAEAEAAARAKAAAEEAARQAQARAIEDAARQARQLGPIYFDYDMFNVRDDQMNVLLQHADILKAASQVKMTLEGHCDERGTIEYNLALGQRRADSAKFHLTRMGVNPDNLKTISYGEERPVAKGQDESAWSKNRRVEFVAAP